MIFHDMHCHPIPSHPRQSCRPVESAGEQLPDKRGCRDQLGASIACWMESMGAKQAAKNPDWRNKDRIINLVMSDVQTKVPDEA